MKIGIFADLHKSSGLGHFKRMMGLAVELKRLNHKCFFIIYKSNSTFVKNKVRADIKYLTLKDNKINNFLDLVDKEKIKTIIFDTYDKKYLFYEKKLKEREIKVIAIDDYLYNHSADTIITNREFIPSKFLQKKKKIYKGFKYALTSNTFKTRFKMKKNKKFKVLFHVGGNEDYKNYEKFFVLSLNYLDKFDKVEITFLAITNKTKKYLKLIKKKNKIKKKINFLNYQKNFASNLKLFDIVCGPLGTTTFETILAGSFPYTFLRQSTRLDPFTSWLKNGHLINLNRNEIYNKKIVTSTWNFTFKNFIKLKKILIEQSSNLDGKANKRVANIIAGKNMPHEGIDLKKISKKKEIEIRKCSLIDIRKFLELRNKPNNKQVSISNKNIIWPDHVNWFLNKNIKKFKLVESNNTKLFFWFKAINDKFGKIIISGIITDKNTNGLKYIGIALRKLDYFVKKNIRNATWIVFNKKKNLIFERFNKSMGFKKIRKNNLLRLKSIIDVNSKIFSVSELKI